MMEQAKRLSGPDDGSHSQELAGFVAGVDIGGTSLRVAIADRQGAIVARSMMPTVGVREPGVIVQMICGGIALLLEQQAIPASDLCAIAAGVPGVTDVEQGLVIATSYLMGWKDVGLRDMLQKTLGVPAAIDNDVNLAAFGESRTGAARSASSFVFIAIGTGIGSGIMLNGELFRGKQWTAGEIGYMLVPGSDDRLVEEDQPGALEAIAGGEGIKAQWQSEWDLTRTKLSREAIASEIFDEAMAGGSLAQSVLERTAKSLSYAIYNIWLVLNCEVVVLGGSVGLHPALGQAIRRLVAERCSRGQIQIVESELGSDAQLRGAIFMALDLLKST